MTKKTMEVKSSVNGKTETKGYEQKVSTTDKKKDKTVEEKVAVRRNNIDRA